MTNTTHIDLQSLVDTHDDPFVIIDRNYRIRVMNQAYERVYGAGGDWIICHDRDRPCDRHGQDCPCRRVFETGEGCSCLYVHYDENHRMHQLRVTAYPLKGPAGELFLGELIQEVCASDQPDAGSERMVGNAPAFVQCVEQLNLAATSDAPVLLEGETGTGKDLAARYIHCNSRRAELPCVTIDCTVLTESLFEDEVFGHERGAFTGSIGEKPGLFEQADGGTLLLDEIGEMPRSQQAKLLRVIETGKYRRVGGSQTHKTNARIICATNRHLWDEVVKGHFREDLYYRIACLSVHMPSLNRRMQDIPALATHLLEQVSRTMQRRYRLTPAALECLQNYHYPGNIRELRNILLMAASRCTNGEISAELISPLIENLTGRQSRCNVAPDTETTEPGPATPSAASLKEVEARHISKLLHRHGGNRKQVANAIGVSERTLYRKLKCHGLNR